MAKDTRKDLFVSNAIAESRARMSELELDIFIAVLDQLPSKVEDLRPVYNIDAKKFYERRGMENVKYDKLKNASKSLMKKLFFEVDTPTEFIQTFAFSSCVYVKGKGIIRIRLTPEIVPHLVDLKERFTAFDRDTALMLGSVYAKRLYIMLSQFKSTGFFHIKVDELRHRLALENKLSKWSHFKKNVIENSVKEINRAYKESDGLIEITSWDAQNEEGGRKMTDLYFEFKYNGEKVKYEPSDVLGLDPWQAKVVSENLNVKEYNFLKFWANRAIDDYAEKYRNKRVFVAEFVERFCSTHFNKELGIYAGEDHFTIDFDFYKPKMN
jgi:plasmid replication initiation protein